MDAVASTIGNMVQDQRQEASVAKMTLTPMRYEDEVYGRLGGAFSSVDSAPSPYEAMQFAGLGAPPPLRGVFALPDMYVTPKGAWIDVGTGAAATGAVYGSGYASALSAWSSSSLGYGGDVDLNEASTR
jgi:hypothetical protein